MYGTTYCAPHHATPSVRTRWHAREVGTEHTYRRARSATLGPTQQTRLKRGSGVHAHLLRHGPCHTVVRHHLEQVVSGLQAVLAHIQARLGAGAAHFNVLDDVLGVAARSTRRAQREYPNKKRCSWGCSQATHPKRQFLVARTAAAASGATLSNDRAKISRLVTVVERRFLAASVTGHMRPDLGGGRGLRFCKAWHPSCERGSTWALHETRGHGHAPCSRQHAGRTWS